MAGPKFTKQQREEVFNCLLSTFNKNFSPFATEKQMVGLALHFTSQICRKVAKYDNYLNNRTFTTDDLRRAFVEYLIERLHPITPGATTMSLLTQTKED